MSVSSFGRVRVAVRCLGPVASAVMNGRLMSYVVALARAHFAFDYDPNQFERFYCMSEQHAMMLNQCLNIPLEKITVMNVSDPFGGDLEVYRRCRDEIYRFVSKVADGYAD